MKRENENVNENENENEITRSYCDYKIISVMT